MSIPENLASKRKAVFLDRDGVINVDHGYISRWEDFEFIPGAIAGMKLLQDHGYLLIIVTNQSGIARGFFSRDDYRKLTDAYRSFLLVRGVVIDGIYHCPHHPKFPKGAINQSCDCRKPQPGLIYKAVANHNIILDESVLIGDKISDILAASNAGIPNRFLLSTDENMDLLPSQEISFVRHSSLLQCAHDILISDC